MVSRNSDNAVNRLGRYGPALAVLSMTAVALVMLMAAVVQAGTMQASWRLAIAGAVVTNSEKVRLGDIAQPVGEMPDAHWQTLARTELWASPAAEGEHHNIPRGKLERMLRYYLGDLAQLCVISGPLVIQRGGRLVEGAELERKVVEILTPKVTGLRGEVSLRDFRLPERLFLSDEQNSLVISVVGEFAPGRLSLLILDQNPAGVTIRKYAGTVFLDQWVTVACAARPINSREVLTPDMVTFMRKNAAFLRGATWDGSRFEMRVTRPMGTGEIIYAENLDDVPLISRGDTVTLIYDGRYVRLTASAEALADGRVGESISVKNMQSKREIVAEVVDGDTVVVR